MSDNGSIVLEGLIISGGGSGGGTAATTSFEPTATIASENVQAAIEEVDSSLSDITKDIAAISGLGGYINSYDFGTATPTQQALTDYALTQLPNITASDVFNGTRVKNLFDNHIWILTNTPNTVPPVFEWADNGYDTVGIASNTVAGLVKGSATNGGLTVASDGTASVTGFNTKYDKTGGTLTGNVTINTQTDLKLALLNNNNSCGGVYAYGTATNPSVLISNNTNQAIGISKGSGIYLQRNPGEIGKILCSLDKSIANGVASLDANGKVPLTELPELGGTAATTSFEPTATIDATNVQDAIEEVDAKSEAVAGDLSDTEINGVAIAGKDNTCEDLGLQCKINESANFKLTQTTNTPVKVLLNFDDRVTDSATSPLVYTRPAQAEYGESLHANSPTKKSILCKTYSEYGGGYGPYATAAKPSLNFDNHDWECEFNRKATTPTNSTDCLVYGSRQDGDNYCGVTVDGRLIVVRGGQYNAFPLSPIPQTPGEIETIKFQYTAATHTLAVYKNGTEIDSTTEAGTVYNFGYPNSQYASIAYSASKADNILFSGFVLRGQLTPTVAGVRTTYPAITEVTINTGSVSLPVNYRQIASKTCTSMSETSLLDTTDAKGTNIIPANTLQVGDVINFDIEGQISALLDATPTVNIKYGSAVLATLAKAFSVASSSVHFHIKAVATIRSIGASGKAVFSGEVLLKSYSAESGGITWPLGGISEVAIDTTTDNALDATVAWSAEDPSNTITAAQAIFSSLLR